MSESPGLREHDAKIGPGVHYRQPILEIIQHQAPGFAIGYHGAAATP